MGFFRATCSVLLLTVWVAGSAYGQDRQLDLLERAATTVSTESAIISLDWREKFMPCVPMEMPSLTPMVLN